MKLTKFYPSDDLALAPTKRWGLSTSFDSLFNFDSIFHNVWEDFNHDQWQAKPDHWKLEINLPKFKKNEVKVEQDNDRLLIRAESKRENSEFSYFREFTIPPNTDSNTLKAKLEDGVLEVVINKTEEAKLKVIDVT